jgi:hypothetical protein
MKPTSPKTAQSSKVCSKPLGEHQSSLGPIPADELQRTYDWMKSWDFLETAPGFLYQ